MDLDLPGIGRRVREARERRGLSAEKLARLAGVTAQTVANVEKGERSPWVGTLGNLAHAMGMRPEDFLLADPGPVDVAFDVVGKSVSWGNRADAEARIRESIEEIGVSPDRFAVWPLDFSGVGLVLRVPPASVAEVARIGGCKLPWMGVTLALAEVQRPAAPSSLHVMVAASSSESAEAEVRHMASRAGCCPAVTVDDERPFLAGTGYICTVSGLSGADSFALQRLPFAGPDGLFVPG